MFTGTNELRLNGATMQTAIQYWLTNQILAANNPGPIVSGVAYDSNASEFIITLKTEQSK